MESFCHAESLCFDLNLTSIFVLQRLWPSLNHGLGVVLADKYTKEVSEAWRKVYIYISVQMKRGMENPDRDFNEDMSVS